MPSLTCAYVCVRAKLVFEARTRQAEKNPERHEGTLRMKGEILLKQEQVSRVA